jgi:hypothetical protein
MASVYILTEPPSNIDYSLKDGRIQSFELRGMLLYDENEHIQIDNWKDELIKFVKDQELDINKDGRGLHAFVYRMIDDGLLANDPVDINKAFKEIKEREGL